jgi:hypothetical protein
VVLLCGQRHQGKQHMNAYCRRYRSNKYSTYAMHSKKTKSDTGKNVQARLSFNPVA